MAAAGDKMKRSSKKKMTGDDLKKDGKK